MIKVADTIKSLEGLITQAKFGEFTRSKLWKYRFKHINNDKETFLAILTQAEKTLCQICMGGGKTFGSVCGPCSGSGERAYDPHIETITDVLDK